MSYSFAALAERLFHRICAPAQRGRIVLASLLAYLLLWTIYAALAKANQDLSPDMVEQIIWSRQIAFGYLKHPPLSPLLVKLWFSLVPLADWTFYLLAMLIAVLALWVAWQVAGDYLTGEKRMLALPLLTLIPFFNFHALNYNVNTVLMPLWAATTLCFLRSFRSRSIGYAALTGLSAAAAMLCKYWSVFLIAGLVVAALSDRRRSDYFRSPAPWIAIIAGLALLSPHLLWLGQHDFAPIRYAIEVHGDKVFATSVIEALRYLAGAAAYVTLPVALVVVAARPSRTAVADMIWPKDPDRRLVVVSFWVPLLLPAALAVTAGTAINSIWSMSAWTLLPIMLLASSSVTIGRTDAGRILALALAIPFVMVLAAPVFAIGVHRTGNLPVSAHFRLLSTQVEQVWHRITGKPLRFVGGNATLAYGIAVYAPDQPRALPDLPPVDVAKLARAGMVIACTEIDLNCMGKAAAVFLKAPATQWLELPLSRGFFGIKGREQRYVIVVVPPRTDVQR